MKVKRTVFITLAVLAVAAIMVGGLVSAHDDGPHFGRNISRTPHTMTGASQMSSMPLYVPAQDTKGECADTNEDGTCGIDYYAGIDCTNQNLDGCTLVYSQTEAKPLIATYNDGIEDELIIPEGMSGIETGAGFGKRDAFAALSLDDGATWKNYNLSDSADRSSFVLKNGYPYPGDVFKLVHQVEGNRVVAAWISRYCESGSPLYSWADEVKSGLLTAYPDLDNPVTVDGGTPWDEDGYQLYLDDMFTVGGSQQSVDYTALGFPDVGEIPYGCVWVARGTLEQDLDETTGEPLFNLNGDPVYDINWRAAERLTSGRRDPHQISITSSPGAGFVVFWQEDPEGLRPGKGLGPGEGWSGAIANSKTDIWYTYIDLAHFADVCTDEPIDDTTYCVPGTLDLFNDSVLFGTKPKAAVPFAMPLRLTDNNMCKSSQKFDTNGDLLDPYCFADFNANSTADLCAESVLWPNAQNIEIPICVAEDGRVMNGRTASTRVRASMKSYDSDADGAPDSAWVLFGEEKLKSLGTVGEDADGNPCDPSIDLDCVPVDIGKNMWYHTFEFDKPELAQQGLMLNAPAKVPFTEDFFPVEVDEFGYEFYDTEIARRFNLFVNSPAAAMASTSKTMGFLIYKQGILFQGGPADIYVRRLVLPEDFDPAVDNPFAYENVQCVAFDDAGVATPVDLLYPDGSNPNYVRGLCPVDGMNVSGTTIQLCDDGSSGQTCAEKFPFDLTYEEWASDADDTTIPKVTEWLQAADNLNDASWVNPYDVSKGHRGFIDGDFVMMMYASAPNWKAGTVGNEAYNLYIRRSFDGGQTWTTLPASFAHIDGLTYSGDGTYTCEDWGWGGTTEYENCTTYGPGDFEQARNVSRLTGTKVTVLDPRYSPSGGMLKLDYKSLLCYDETAVPTVIGDAGTGWINCGYTEAPYPTEIRDPSAFFATFETGDNTVVTVETGASPLDMYYSRASNFGDDWDEQDICATDLADPWYPSAGATCTTEDGTVATELRWDWLENGDDWATEASVEGNPDGSKFYAVWNQELFLGLDAEGEELYTDMDSLFRRIFYNLSIDTLPTSSIVYVSDFALDISKDDTLLLIGSGRDHDHLGSDTVNYSWTDEKGTILCEISGYDDFGDPIYACTKEAKINAASMTPGVHKIKLSVQDGEGNWSKEDTVEVFVALQLYDIHLPSVLINK